MAKNDIIANHKKGLVNSTVGNGFRGGLWGAAIFGGIAAIATIATGGLALPVVALAAGGGAALFGTMNAVGGAARWGVEAIGGILGFNRKQRNNNGYGEPGQEQNQQHGVGLAEGLVTLLGAAMGLTSMKNKLSQMGGQNQNQGQAPHQPGQSPQQFAQQGGYQQAPSAFMPPQVPEILADKMQDGKLRLSKEDLANPDIRGAVAGFGQQQLAYRDALATSGNRQMMEQARDMNAKAMEYPGYNEKSETFSMNPEHLMDKNIVKHINSDGERREKQHAKEMKTELRDLQREGTDISRGRLETQFRSEEEAVAAPAPAPKDEGADRTAAQRTEVQESRIAGKEAELATGKGDVVLDSLDKAFDGKTAAPQQPAPKVELEQHSSGLILAKGNANLHDVVRAAGQDLKGMGAQLKGSAETARAGGGSAGQQRQGPAVGG